MYSFGMRFSFYQTCPASATGTPWGWATTAPLGPAMTVLAAHGSAIKVVWAGATTADESTGITPADVAETIAKKTKRSTA